MRAAMVQDAVGFSQFTDPMKKLLGGFATSSGSPSYVVSSANPRIVGGKPSKNPRYLQLRPDRSNPVATVMADIADHLLHHRALSEFAPLPVDIVAAGRRNNPPAADAPALCSYNPLHYMELPELFCEFISSMTGKSPSTTGAGSEGRAHQGPVQHAAEHHRPQRGVPQLRVDRVRRLDLLGRTHRAEGTGRPRLQPARAGDLQPHVARRARRGVAGGQRLPGPDPRRRAGRESDRGEPPRLPHQPRAS